MKFKRIASLAVRNIPMAVVGLLAAWQSWYHISAVAAQHHQPHSVAAMYPAGVDGGMAVMAIALAEDRREGRRPRPWAHYGFWAFAAFSVFCNVTAVPWGWFNAFVSAWPALTLLFCVETVARKGKLIEPKPAATVAALETEIPATVLPASRPANGTRVERAPARVDLPAIRTKALAMKDSNPSLTREDIATLLGVGKDTLNKAWPSEEEVAA